jgi:dTDP-4-amino-4,6-dideoxygalactose transaminase
MLKHIERQRTNAVSAILASYRERYLPHAVLTPSGRFGLYAAAKELLRPGDRVAISPVTCRSVVEAFLAAGVSPVFVDIELSSGNIDVRKISDKILRAVRAIVTTNLYGNPDCALELKSIAASRNLLLIEDCAHVLDTSVGRQPIGGIGDVSVFSFRKYFDEPGGVVTARSEAAAAKIRARVAAEAVAPPEAEERARYFQYRAASAAKPVAAGLAAVYRHWNRSAKRRTGSNGALESSAALPRSSHRSLPTTGSLLRVRNQLSDVEKLVVRRNAAADSLIAQCPLEMKRGDNSGRVCYLAVPFFSSRRNAIISAMEARGIPTYFRYTPPLNEVFQGGPVLDFGLDRDAVAHWCRNILPVRFPFGPQYLEVIRGLS